MDALFIKDGIVKNVIVIEEPTEVEPLKQALQADALLDRSLYSPVPQIGWIYNAGPNTFTPVAPDNG